jgi:hypothetical protein
MAIKAILLPTRPLAWTRITTQDILQHLLSFRLQWVVVKKTGTISAFSLQVKGVAWFGFCETCVVDLPG